MTARFAAVSVLALALGCGSSDALANAPQPKIDRESIEIPAGSPQLASIATTTSTLFTAFDSARLAGLILFNVPFSAIGGILALPLAGLSLSVSALVGFIALFGVSVQNGVLLVERIRDLRVKGVALHEAATRGAIARMRAVVMTASMAAFGLLPMALSHGVGAETARPFAVVIIGGLVSATVLTLLVLPVLYPFFETPAAIEARRARTTEG